jgi:hypothetical protein
MNVDVVARESRATVRVDLRWWLPALTSLVVFVFRVRRFCGSADYYIDDPFISMRFAANLVRHGELSFNPGQRVEGYSNFLLVLADALAFKLRGGVPDAVSGLDGAAVGLIVVSLATALILGLLAIRSQGSEDNAAWYFAWVFTLAGWQFALWATIGLETPIETLLYVAVLYVCSSRALRDGRGWALGVVSALLVGVTLVRFEGAVVALCVAFTLGACFLRAGRRQAALRVCAPVVVVTGVYHVWRVVYFGHLLPNTYVAKAGGAMLTRISVGAGYWGAWLGPIGGAVVVMLLVVGLSRAGTVSRETAARVFDHPVILVASVIAAVKLALVTWGGGDWMPGWRMLEPIVPVVFFLVARIAAPGTWRPTWVTAMALSAGILLAGRGGPVVANDHPEGPANDAGGLKTLCRSCVTIGQRFERGFGGSREEVAISEAGLIGYEALDVRFMDLHGLVDSDMAHQPGALHDHVHAAHVIERAPAAVLFAHLHHLPPYGNHAYARELLTNDAFHAKYARVDLGPEVTSLGWALYLRRDVDAPAHGFEWVSADPLAPATAIGGLAQAPE